MCRRYFLLCIVVLHSFASFAFIVCVSTQEHTVADQVNRDAHSVLVSLLFVAFCGSCIDDCVQLHLACCVCVRRISTATDVFSAVFSCFVFFCLHSLLLFSLSHSCCWRTLFLVWLCCFVSPFSRHTHRHVLLVCFASLQCVCVECVLFRPVSLVVYLFSLLCVHS